MNNIVESAFAKGVYEQINVYYSREDQASLLAPEPIEFYRRHAFSKNIGNKASHIFYLRGNRKKVAHKDVLIAAIEQELYDPILLKMAENCQFWNSEGYQCYKMNGNPSKESYFDFILKCISCDARAFVEANPQFITGTGSNHVWISSTITKERIMIIHF